MELEQGIKNVIEAKLSDGTIEKAIAEKFEKGVNEAFNDLFCSYGGDIKKAIQEKIKSVMLSRLETYDYSEYIVKLDDILQQVLNATALDNKKLLTNFKDLMMDNVPKKIKMSEIFEQYKLFVEKNVSTSGLEVVYDDGVSYEYVDVSLEVEQGEKPRWSSFDTANVTLECEHDEDMLRGFKLHKWDRNNNWDIIFEHPATINSLRSLDNFTIYLMKLSQNGTEVELDIECDEDQIQPEAEPEATFS